MQNGQPIAYASRSLNKAEKNNAMIEKEMAAIVFGATRFHEYIIIWTDSYMLHRS